MEFKTALSFVKEVAPGQSISYGRTWKASQKGWIGTMPVGYGDGYSRLLSGKAEVLMRGKRFPLAGRICMDQSMIDLGQNSDIEVGEEVTLFGPHPAGPGAFELAKLIGTIPYEILCWVGKRVPRDYRS